MTAVIAKEWLPITGQSVKGFSAFERRILSMMRKYGLPGLQAAVSFEGCILYERGFGYADLESATFVEPDSLFRIASLSKPITAVAILKLIEKRMLHLDDKVLDLLDNLVPPFSKLPDRRWQRITVRHLLEHSGGFDREIQGDQQFIWYQEAADALGYERPASATAIVSYAMTQKLAFDPGTRYAYSNLGYNILGRVIERVSGRGYEDFVKDEIGGQAGLTSMQVGRTELALRHSKEVRFYDTPCKFSRATHCVAPTGTSIAAPTSTGIVALPVPRLGRSLFDIESLVEIPYGASFVMESMDAHGGWILSASDMVRFICAIDGQGRMDSLLMEESIKSMVEPPKFADDKANYYAKGWRITRGGNSWMHNGALLFSSGSVAIRLKPGLVLSVMCNHLPEEWEYFIETKLRDELCEALPKALKKIDT